MITKKLGHLLLGVYLVLIGLLPLLGIGTPILHTMMGIVAIAAGVLIVMDK
jgi:hypothetical protein